MESSQLVEAEPCEYCTPSTNIRGNGLGDSRLVQSRRDRFWMETMMTAKLIGIALMATALASPAWAQAGKLSASDEAFLTKDAMGAAYELQSAKLATTKATRPDIKAYAAKLVHDHEAYNAALEKLGQEHDVKLSMQPDAADAAHLLDLNRASGSAFDTLYVQEAIRVNKEDKQAGDAEKASTKSQVIKDFIAKFAAMDAGHEKLAKTLEKAGG